MSSEDTMISNELKFQVGNGASPETFANFCEVTNVGALGEEKPLIDVTALCDAARTYRGGLPDGIEIPLAVNFIQGSTAIREMYQQYQSNEVRTFRLTLDGTSPEEYFEFRAICRAWNLGLPNGDKVAMNFTLKISGGVDWVYA